LEKARQFSELDACDIASCGNAPPPALIATQNADFVLSHDQARAVGFGAVLMPLNLGQNP
jgi:hypothetical protein